MTCRHVEDTCRQALVRNPSATDIADRLVISPGETRAFLGCRAGLSGRSKQIHGVASAWRVRNALRAGDFSRAIEELKLRVSNDNRDANSRIVLARLIYWQTRDTAQALRYIKEAEAIAPGSLSVTAVKAAILRAEGQTEEAREDPR